MKWIYPTNPAFKHELRTFKRYELTYSTKDVRVYAIDNKYVLKESNNMVQFLREIEHGTRPELRKGVHVRIHAYWIHPKRTSGMYIMDHASFGATDVQRTITAKAYLKSPHFNPATFFPKFRSALQGFYRAFRGFHGDLHAKNVMVNLGPKNGLKSVVIIDYANIVPFINNKNSEANKNTSVNNVQRAFKALPTYGYEEYPKRSGIQVKWVDDIPVRSNVDMLHKLHDWKPLRVIEKPPSKRRVHPRPNTPADH